MDKTANRTETQQQARADRRDVITRAWRGSAKARAFIAALEKEGYHLASDGKQCYVVVDASDEAHSLTRQIEGVKAKEIKAFLAGVPPEIIPDIQAARERAAQQRGERLGRPGNSARQNKTFAPALACVPYALLVLAVLLAYSNVYGNEFLWDDLFLITDNKYLTSWNHIGTLFVPNVIQQVIYRPLQILLYLFVYQAAGPSIVAFHLLNIALHAANACLLYTLGVRLGFQRVAAFLAALLWAVHPVQTEAVDYMSGTADPLCGAFLLAGTLALIPGFSHRRVLAACALFALGLLSKETALAFPALAMGLLFYRSENRWSPKTYLKTWPFWLIAALYLVARDTVLNLKILSGYAAWKYYPLSVRFSTFLATLPAYLRLLVWPTGLHFGRIFPMYMVFWTPQVLMGLLMLTAALSCIVWQPKARATPLAWGILWAIALYGPQSGILVRGFGNLNEHWLYLPTMGLALGLGESLAQAAGTIRASRFRHALAALAVLIACLFGAMTFEQNRVWRDPLGFYDYIFSCGEDSPTLRNNRGAVYLFSKGQYALAIEDYRRSLAFMETADAHYYLAYAALKLDQNAPIPEHLPESIKHFKRALEIDPDYYNAADMLAFVYVFLGDNTATLEYHNRAVEIRKKLGIEDSASGEK